MFPVGLRIPISFPFSCDKTGQQLLSAVPQKTIKGDEEEIQEATASLAPAKEISLDGAAAAVLSEPGGIFTFKEEQRRVPKAFLRGGIFFALLPRALTRV